ncbi:Rieske (2Fe-2S) protein [Trinickia sp.]|uniref:Rieske (2Fe-2S) protein n=1 Tax=Trinickia sp. TaxID=2571163 RepID=UPI003F7F6483
MVDMRLCLLEEVPDGGARVIDAVRTGVSIVVLRRGEHAWAYVNRCPHFSVPLDFEPGTISCYRAQVLMCAHHSALFRFEDGYCIEGPCAGATLDALTVGVDVSGWVMLRQ